MHVTEFLKSPEKHPVSPVVALFGEDRWLKGAALAALSRLVLGESDESESTRFTGKDTDLKTVCDELLTISMWGDRRLVIVEDADPFVTNFRAGLEKYVKKPARKSVLVLDVKTWPKNTRLAKLLAEEGLELDCKSLDGAALAHWLRGMCRDRFGKQLQPDAQSLLVELAGKELGLLEQELAKLAAYVGERSEISAEDVRTLVGGWTAETVFQMTGAMQAGNVGLALKHLDRLLSAGEAPQRILGGINAVYRKLIRAAEQTRGGTRLDDALRQAGVFPKEIDLSARYLRKLGRSKVEEFSERLREADGNLKGASRLPERIVLEQLTLQLSGRA